MATTTRRMQGLTIDDHTIEVPLVWGVPVDGRTIDVHASVVTREDGETLAGVEWPKLYDADAIAASGAEGAAAVYYNDLFVPVEHSMATAELMPDVRVHVTSEHEHSGLRTGNVRPKLIDLAAGRRVR